MNISTNKGRTDLRKAAQSLGNIFALSMTGWLMVEISEPCLLRHVSGDIRIFSVQLLIALLSASLVGIFFPMVVARIRARNEHSTGKSRIFSAQLMGKTDLDHFIQQTIERSPNHAELETEVKIFQNVLDFSNIRLKDCMVPRTEIVAFDLKTSKEELLAKFIETGLSKILIYNENIDDIVGYIHSTEMFTPSAQWKANIKKIPIVPETMAANKLMKILMQDKRTIAVVVDEFGGTVGLVTLEDLVEEIFGDIEDEHDIHSYVAKKKSETEFILSGRMEVDKVNEMFGLTLPESTDYQTIAGLILRECQRFPNFNDTIVSGRFSFTILRKTATKIELIKLKIAE
jgi:CBS domain containing-hemolysin-like protein